MVVAWGSFASACVIFNRVVQHGAISYAEGGWRAPWGIELRIDLLNALVLLIVTGICAIVLTASPRSLDQEIWRENHSQFYALYLLCMTGLAGMTVTGDAFNIFVFLEISSLSSYTLISQGTTRRALTSSIQYLVMGTIGGTFILLGIGMIYMVTGTLNIVDMAVQLAAVGPNRTVLVALACIGIGTGIKLAVFPLHIWLPNAYTYAPAIVTAFLAATATKVAYYVLVRFVFSIFGAPLAFGEPAPRRRADAARHRGHVRRLDRGHLPGRHQAHAGLLERRPDRLHGARPEPGLGERPDRRDRPPVQPRPDEERALPGDGCVLLRIGSMRIEAMPGLGRRMPLTMAAFVVAGLSMIGVPLTVGFVSKWYLVIGAIEAGLWPVAVLILLSSLLALIYIWRVIEVAYFRQPPDDAPEIDEAPPACWSDLGAGRRHRLLRDLHLAQRRRGVRGRADAPGGGAVSVQSAVGLAVVLPLAGVVLIALFGAGPICARPRASSPAPLSSPWSQA